jgi:hypothetical protein
MCNEITPWNPSAKAIARVKDPLPPPIECPHCHDLDPNSPRFCEPFNHIEIVNNEEIYGRSYGEWPWVYQCQQCEAYVGMHPFTNIPLGTLADGPTRQARKQCKEPFENLYRSGRMSRSDAYARLAEKLGIPASKCHFGMFDVAQCKKAAEAAREIFLECMA